MPTNIEAESAAVAKFPTGSIKAEVVATTTEKIATIVQGNAAYGAHPEIQQATTAWVASANAVDQASQKVKAAHITLRALIATLVTSMSAWKRTSHTLVALINAASAGSAETIAGWGFATTARQAVPPSIDPPSGLRVLYSKQFVMKVRWSAVSNHLGYSLQMGDGTPTGWGASLPCARASYLPQGLTPGQKVAFRVAVQRKNGLSNWSDALIVTVR